MSTLRGIAVGSLSLAVLDVLVSTDQAAERAGGVLTGIAGLVHAFMDPAVPAIRDRSGCLDNGNPGHTKKSGGGGLGGLVTGGAKAIGGLVTGGAEALQHPFSIP